ncbi:uncharacterized protein LOC106804314 isoform X2 [Setaria italica]|uniref:uncharacterized protein LOC106804314 isoform X2 n=1 Tax=Setaria italica TaxID=4555 RepID=UPI0007199E2A|nr:uncharacterized protein LOC106804314 isoform X2 [Setaria italica]
MGLVQRTLLVRVFLCCCRPTACTQQRAHSDQPCRHRLSLAGPPTTPELIALSASYAVHRSLGRRVWGQAGSFTARESSPVRPSAEPYLLTAHSVHETKLKVDLIEYVEKHEFVFDVVLDEDVSNDEVVERPTP